MSSFCPPAVRVERKRNGLKMAEKQGQHDDIDVADTEAVTVADNSSDNAPKRKWKWLSMKPLKNVVNIGVRKIQGFLGSSKVQESKNRLFDELRNTTFSRHLQEKHSRPDTSFAQVKIFVDDFVLAESDGQFDIDKVLAALKNLNKLLL